MKHLIFLLLPLAGWGQIQINPASISIDSVWSSPSSVTKRVNFPKSKSQIDTTYGTVEYLIKVDSVTYEAERHPGYKVELFTITPGGSGGCGDSKCFALHLKPDIYERRLLKIVANGREINRYKYYTFIPKQ